MSDQPPKPPPSPPPPPYPLEAPDRRSWWRRLFERKPLVPTVTLEYHRLDHPVMLTPEQAEQAFKPREIVVRNEAD